MRPLLLAVVLAFFYAVGAPAHGASTVNPPGTQAFVDNAADIDEFDIRVASIALKKTDNPKIVQYARMLVQDHTKAQHDLELIVGLLNGVSIPTSLDKAYLTMLQQLEASSGESFERTFKYQQIEVHKKSLQLAEAYADHGENGYLREFARAIIPILQKHLVDLKQLPPSSD